ncbi:unnamed protein product, partial [Brassica oleracea var. botrytis]
MASFRLLPLRLFIRLFFFYRFVTYKDILSSDEFHQQIPCFQRSYLENRWFCLSSRFFSRKLLRGVRRRQPWRLSSTNVQKI